MKRIIFIISSLAFAAYHSMAQDCKGIKISNNSIKVENVRLTNNGNSLALNMTMSLDSLHMPANNQFVLTPYVKTKDESIKMPQIVVNGRRQHIMHERGNGKKFGPEAYIIKRKNGKPQQINYLRSVDFNKKLGNYSIAINEDLCGCGDSIDNRTYTLKEYKRLTAKYIKPKVVAEKIMELDKRAYIDFPVNRTELNPLYRRNPEQLDSIVKTINALKEDRNLTVVGINIHGFASPESPLSHNDWLAENRARTLCEYVQRMVKLDKKIFSVSHTAEDWDGLRKFISESNLEHKKEILAIACDSTLQEDEREAKIKKEYPEEYKFMLINWYPALRHSDYHITYKVRPFNVEEAKKLIKTRPQLLSQNEMYMVAQTYEPGSDEFNEIMEIAVRMFPDDPTANLNAACSRLNAGDADGAKPYLDKSGTSKEAQEARKIYEEIK